MSLLVVCCSDDQSTATGDSDLGLADTEIEISVEQDPIHIHRIDQVLHYGNSLYEKPQHHQLRQVIGCPQPVGNKPSTVHINW